MRQAIAARTAEALLWVVGGAASYFAAQFIVMLAAGVLAGLGVRLDVSDTVTILTIRLIVYVLTGALLAGLLWLRVRKRVTLASFGLQRLLRWKDIGFALIAAVVYFVGTVAMMLAATTWFGLDTEQAQDLGISTRLYGGELLAAFVVLVVATPLLEEMLFRGFLYGKLRGISKRVSWWLPALVVSVLFGLAHGQWNVGLDVFVLSMVACALREVTGSIWAGTVLHMVKNMVAFMLVFVFTGGVGS